MLAAASATPEDLFLPSPVPVHALDGSSFQAPLPALERNFAVFSVVPDSSERKNTVMFALGSLASGVELGDLRVVPGLDGAVEDLGEHLGIQHELVDAVDVVGEGDRADHHRQVPGRVVLAAFLGFVSLDDAVNSPRS